MVRSLVHPATSERPPRIALFAKGFRPFFLCAAAYAVLAMPLFLLLLSGQAALDTYLGSTYWHAHEMIFGFTAAVLAGFLLTAVSNWTQRPTASGLPLAVLATLWLAGRVAMWLPERLPHYIPAILDVAFIPALLIACARPIVASRNRRNYGFVLLLGAFAACNALIHAGGLELVASSYVRLGSWVAADILLVALVVMSGRVVPMFTRNAVRDERIHSVPALEHLTTASVVLIAILEALGAGATALGSACLVAGVLSAVRMRTWGTQHTLRVPLLWILHAGSMWIAVGLLLRAASSFWPVPLASGLHAITAGAIGALTIGMMTRVGLGHTGRLLTVPRRIAIAFALVLFGGVVRVLAPVLWPGAVGPLAIAGVCWSAGFAIYLIDHARLLITPRVDGRPG